MIVAGSLIGCSPQSAPAPTPTQEYKSCVGNAITVGDISDDPDEIITSRVPFINYLADKLAAFGIECGKPKVVDTIDEMITLVNNGDVDIYMDSMYPATLISNATGARPILRRWRNCDPEYYSVIFTTSSIGINSIADLPGHMIAMDTVYSTSGFVLPAVYLIDNGFSLVIKDSYTDPVGENEIGIFFSFDDKNTLNLVLEGKVAAGATDDFYFGKWQTESSGGLVKLAETESVPRQVVIVRAGLENDVQTAIKDILANAHLDPTGLSVMKQDADTCKYDDTPEGIEAAFKQMQAMHEKIMEIPGWEEAAQSNQ